MLTAERIDARAILAFGGLHGQAHLLAERAGKEAAHTMGLPTGGSHGVGKQMHLGRRVSPYVSA